MSQKAGSPSPEFIERCERLGLNPNVVYTHYSRVIEALERPNKRNIPISDTCRIDNGGLLAVQPEKLPATGCQGVVSFVPAAGASSRYYKPFAKLLLALESGSQNQVAEQINHLRSIGADRWPLPGAIKTLFSGNSPDYRAAAAALSLPKGLLPCAIEGDSFFDLKLAEDAKLSFLDGSVFVVAPEHRRKFEAATPPRFADKVAFTEQGPSLSTIRINETGQPYIEEDGGFSLVPAGHGMLAGLIPSVKQSFPKAHSVLIRNVDNVIGTSKQVTEAATNAARTHSAILSAVQDIRDALAYDRIAAAEKSAIELADILGLALDSDPLWSLLTKLFHVNDGITKSLFGNLNRHELLSTLYRRPVNTMGMVPNTNHDVGGTPVFAAYQNLDIKLCLEVPHASKEDKQTYLANPEKATHFNPVFVFAEIDFDTNYYQHPSMSSWLLAEKTYKGRTVYYYETILYELLGNNLLANSTFIEIPRTLFNPHKHPKDAAGRRLADWVI